jgi:hypothetical protein
MFKPLLAITCLAVSNFAIASNGKWGVFVGSTVETVSGKKQQNITELFIPIVQTEDNMTFIDLRGQLSKGDKGAISLGFGHRRKLNDTIAIGANASYDSSKTQSGNKANQAALGLELFVKKTSLKVNFSRPVGSSSNQVGDLVNYAHLDGDKIKISKSAIYEATMGGYSLELGHSFVLANGVTLSGDVTYYNYSKDGHESYTGTRATISATKAMDFWGLDGTFGGYVGLEDNNRNGTDVIAGVSAKFYLGKKGKRNSSKFSYLDRQMGSGISRRSTSVTGTKYENYSVDAATEIYGREFSYIKQLDAEDNIAAEISNVDNNGKIILLKGTKGAIQITENVNIADNNVVIGKGRAFIVTGPNGEQATLILDEDAATIATSNDSSIGLGSNSILADMNIENATLNADGKNNIKVMNVDMVREHIESEYSTITITNSSNITLDNVDIVDNNDVNCGRRSNDCAYTVAVNFSENLSILNSEIHSETTNAVFTLGTSNITIEDSEFSTNRPYHAHNYTMAALRFDNDGTDGGYLQFNRNTVNGAFSQADFTFINVTGNTFNSASIEFDNHDDGEEQIYTVLNFNGNTVSYRAVSDDTHTHDNFYVQSTDEVNMDDNTFTDMEQIDISDNGTVNISNTDFVYERPEDANEHEQDETGDIRFEENDSVTYTATGDNRNTVSGYDVSIEENGDTSISNTDFYAAEDEEESTGIVAIGSNGMPNFTPTCNPGSGENFPACLDEIERSSSNFYFRNNTVNGGHFVVVEMDTVEMSNNVMTDLNDYFLAGNLNVEIDQETVSTRTFDVIFNDNLSISNSTYSASHSDINFHNNNNLVLFKNIFNASRVNIDSIDPEDAIDVRENTVNSTGDEGLRIGYQGNQNNVIDGNTIVMSKENGEMYGLILLNSSGQNISNNTVVFTKDQSGNPQAVGLYLNNVESIEVTGLKVQDATLDIQINLASEVSISGSESINTMGTAKNQFVVDVLSAFESSEIIDTLHRNGVDLTEKIEVIFRADDGSHNVDIVQNIDGRDSISLVCEGDYDPTMLTRDIENGYHFTACYNNGI